ncbi:GntR family transcriptional regulator [Tuanshanicoccus lijuaniae]|uniref:GntR family transcriptional regulator n=1 Tax=Aerococcaceae bacterium zg-1292 TaxID=2774330 RepID=UPI001936EA25|nr:GntR family transcriptional regulator [Aerococcaceae bacterium zg-1292]QQA36606.1 GntR family transcriptional regulator [Aerococcaceae bacterium zg-1292]
MQGSLPLYEQLKQSLSNYIEENLAPNDKLPSENEIMFNYNVSRTTVRKALKSLEYEGLIYKKKGIGSFVKFNKNIHKLGNYKGFSEKMTLLGINIEYSVLKTKIVPANKMIAQFLDIEENSDVFLLERIGSHNNTPLNLTISYLPYKLVKGIENIDLQIESLYETLENEYDIKILGINREIEAIKIDYELSNLLQINEGLPVLKFNGQVKASYKDVKKINIEYFHTFYRTDNIKFYIEEKTE